MEEIAEKEIVHSLVMVSKLHKSLVTKMVASTGLGQSQHRLLMHLAVHECTAQTELAAALQITTPSVAVALKKLEKAGYIAKAMNEEDNRYNRIVITEKGRKLVEESRSIFHGIDKKIMDGFSNEEKEQLYDYLNRMSENLKKEK